MPEKITLKDCPCCSGRAEFYHCLSGIGFTALTYHSVGCVACGLHTREYTTVADAVTAWNKRPPRRRRQRRQATQQTTNNIYTSPRSDEGTTEEGHDHET